MRWCAFCSSEPKPGWSGFLDDAGATIVEFTVSAAVLLMALFGIIQCSLALYVYNYVSDAAREATRYAMVRGSSCTLLTGCNVTQAEIQTYLRGFQYPGVNVSNLNATATWLSQNASSPTGWTACGSPCEAPGNQVRVQVTYTFPLSIPFWKNSTVDIASTSEMVISN
jgi:Flp pilus assembly protein TadG